jgi:phage terminase small subunit
VKNSTKDKPPVAPKGYSPAARQLWTDVVTGWSVDSAALVILAAACEDLMRVEQARAIIDAEGLVSKDRFGQAKAHPAVSVERDAKSGMLRALSQLGLDLEPLHDRPGRPGGR